MSRRRAGRPRRHYAARIVREARLLAAANLGGVAGYFLWRTISSQGHAAEGLTLAKYTANFASYRQGLIDAARVPLIAYAIIVALFAIVAMGLYELLAYGLTRFLGRSGGEPGELVLGGAEGSDRTA